MKAKGLSKTAPSDVPERPKTKLRAVKKESYAEKLRSLVATRSKKSSRKK